MVRGSPKHPGLPLTFSGNPIGIGEKFLAILVPVDESEITNSTTPEFKIGENSGSKCARSSQFLGKIKMKNTPIKVSKLLTIILAVALLFGTTNGHSTANAENKNHDDKVKLDCLDAALTLVTLDFAIDLGGEDLETDLSSTLDEAEIAPDLESIEDNFQNALDKVEDICDEDNVQDILDFIDFSD